MKYIIIVFLLSPILAFVQKQLPEYKASNNVTYHPGDTVMLGMGSATNGNFMYVQVAGFAQSSNQDQNNLPRGFSGRNAVIRNINSVRHQGSDKVYFLVGLGLRTNYYLVIEDAIATCEIPCNEKDQPDDKYDQLKKLKALLDDGAIAQEEYDKEKTKLLEGL